jgi:hypothetical protein
MGDKWRRRQRPFANGRTGSRPGDRGRFRMQTGQRRARRLGWAGELAAVTAVGVFLGVLGPFGSFFNGPMWQRVGYWVVLDWLSWACFAAAAGPLLRRAGAMRAAMAILAAFSVVLAVPMGVVSWVLARAIWPELNGAPGLTPAIWYLQSLIATAPLVVLLGLLRRSAASPAAGDAVRAPGVAPSADLLGVSGDQVVCLQMEDHYVRVHTAGGRSHMVLATLAQAMAARGEAAGLRVHRSWWVAEGAVAGVVADGRKLRLILTTGVEAPVARSAVAAVRGAGWLEPKAGAAT